MKPEIKLFAKREIDTTWTRLEIDQSQSINLSKQLSTIEEVDVIKCDGSKTLFCPANQGLNSQFFENFEKQFTFNPLDFYEARIEVDGVNLLWGTMYLKGYNWKQRGYNIEIASKVGSLSARLGDKTMADLPVDILNRYIHDYTPGNMQSSWTSNAGWRSRIKYMPTDIGYGLGLLVDGALNDFRQSDQAIPFGCFLPAINLVQACKDVLESAGLLGSSILLDGSDPVWVLLKSPQGGATRTGTSDDNTYLAPLDPNFDQYEPVSFANVGGDLTLNANGTFTVPALTDPKVDFSLTAEIIKPDYISSAVVGFKVEGSVSGVLAEWVWGGTNRWTARSFSKSFNVVTGETITVYKRSAYVSVRNADWILGVTSSIVGYLSGIKQYDLLTSYIKQFNAKPVQSFSDGKINIYSYRDLTDGAPVVDWTSKVEYNQDYDSNSLVDFLPKTINLLFSDVKNYQAKRIKEIEGNNYGSMVINFGLGTRKEKSEFKTMFAPWINTEVAAIGAGIKLMHFFEDINKPQKGEVANCIAYFRGTTPLNYYMRDADNKSVALTVFPTFDMTNAASSLHFKKPGILPDGNETPSSNDTFERFFEDMYRDWIGLIYINAGVVLTESKLVQSRLLECSAWLTPAEFNAITLGETVTITNHLGTSSYRILEISNFDPLNRKACKVKLIRIVP